MGKKKTGGRSAGTPNKSTQDLFEKCKRLNCDPFEILVHMAKGDWKTLGYKSEQTLKGYSKDGSPLFEDSVPVDIRAKSAQELCQYLYPKRKAIEMSNEGDKGFRLIVEDYTSK